LKIDSQLVLTKSDGQVNYDAFSIKENQYIMKDFKDMTLQEREEILEQIRNLPDESKDELKGPIDIFTHSFNELSQNWSNALKEFDIIYSDCKKESDVDYTEEEEEEEEKDESGGWRERIRRAFY
jgi:hypothetical protein